VDNLTHALAGLLAAEAAVRLRGRRVGEPASSFRATAYVIGVVGNNLPDLDFLWAGVTERPLGYLLHHRGHSHTLVAALGWALILAAVVAAVARRKKGAASRADRGWLFGLCLLGPIFHMAMDYCNNYGVHPFWPFYDGWLYGDAVFIVEPFFWAVGVPPLLFAARSLVTRLVLGSLLVLGLSLAWTVDFVPWGMALSLTLVAIACAGAAFVTSSNGRALLGVGGWLLVVVVFAMASRAAASIARGDRLRAGETVHDVVVTPMPANPFCFDVLAVETRGGDYVARKATVAILPSIIASDGCPEPRDIPTAPLVRSQLASRPELKWREEFVAPIGELSALARDNCQVAAFLRFGRVPYWTHAEADHLVFGDLRYDRNPGLDFADMRVQVRPTSCPRAVPPWLPPRRDILGQF
jgi:inner membrane protein